MLERTEKSGQIDRQTDRQIDRQTDRHIDQKQYTPARIAECNKLDFYSMLDIKG